MYRPAGRQSKTKTMATRGGKKRRVRKQMAAERKMAEQSGWGFAFIKCSAATVSFKHAIPKDYIRLIDGFGVPEPDSKVDFVNYSVFI